VLGAAGAVWVADYTDGRVSRIDPATGTITARVAGGAQPCGMAYGAGSVWVEDYGGNSVTRIHLPDLRTRSYPVGGSPFDVTFAGGAAWVTNYADGTVTRVDAATGRGRTLTVGSSPEGIARAGGAVWVANHGSGTVSRISTASLRVTTIRTGGAPSWTAYSADTVWIGDQAAGTVMRINARTGAIVARVKVGAMPNDGDVLDGAAWFPDMGGGLYRISTTTNAVTGPFALNAGNPFTLAAYRHRLWIADFAGTDVIEVNPARLPTTVSPAR
jgi:YVTN family beta-propeller protein